jgi:hypothetical protein
LIMQRRAKKGEKALRLNQTLDMKPLMWYADKSMVLL